jgi:hypothetical protein
MTIEVEKARNLMIIDLVRLAACLVCLFFLRHESGNHPYRYAFFAFMTGVIFSGFCEEVSNWCDARRAVRRRPDAGAC